MRSPRSLKDLIEKDYLAHLYKPGIHNKTKASHVFNNLCTSTFLNGAFNTYCKKEYKEIIRKQCPYNKAHLVCKEMDESGGVLNQSCISHLRRIEQLGKYGRGGYLCSTDKIKNIQKIVHGKMNEICPYEMIDEDGIDGVEFDGPMLLDCLLKMFKLNIIAREEGNVKIASTIDGADLSRNVQHVTCGVKIVDPRAINPMTGIPIGLEGVQSRDFCFPVKILLTKDSKALYKSHFSDFFSWTKKLNVEGEGPYKPFCVASPQDVSSFWKCIGRGGACKRDQDFCHCCDIKSDDIITPNLTHCNHCVRFNNLNCFHRPVGDKEHMKTVKSELRILIETYNEIFDRENVAKMTIKLAPNDVFASNDINNIDFDPKNDEQRREFSESVNNNLELLNLSRRGNFSVRRDLLRKHLEALEQKRCLQDFVNNFCLEGSMILIEQAIPCILHMENRVGEKMLKLLLIDGANERDSDKSALSEMIEQVNEVVNSQILGTQRRKSNWTVNLTKEGTVAEQPMTNNHTRKIINNFELILPICVSDPEQRQKWLECIELWREVVETARQKEDFLDDQIDLFQHLCDVFFQKWIDLHQRDGIGNYIHMVGAGHLSYYLRKWRNLYRYSQQGWEALNSQIKTVYFRRTQRGGHKGNGECFNSKVEPIAKWVQRCLFWKAGMGQMFEEDPTS